MRLGFNPAKGVDDGLARRNITVFEVRGTARLEVGLDHLAEVQVTKERLLDLLLLELHFDEGSAGLLAEGNDRRRLELVDPEPINHNDRLILF